MGLQVLLHVVGACEFLRAACESTLDRLLSCMDLRVPRGMAGGGEGLLAAMAVAIAARVSLSGPFGRRNVTSTGACGLLIVVRGRAIIAESAGTLIRAQCMRRHHVVIEGRPSVGRVGGVVAVVCIHHVGCQRRHGLVAHLRVV